jgi:hypothetical protein
MAGPCPGPEVTVCDLTIASDKAVFGQVGPKVGSVDPGFGTASKRDGSPPQRSKDHIIATASAGPV